MLHEISACQTSASCIGTADEARTVIDYNGSLLPTQVKGTNGVATLATTTLDHDARGNVISVDGPLSGTADTTAYKYDAADQLTGIISPDPDGAGPLPNRAIRISYREDGQVINRELGTTAGQDDTAFANMTVLQNVDTFYDANSRPDLSRWRGFNGTSLVRFAQAQWSYDALGRLECTAVRMDRSQFSNDNSLGACTLGANTNPKDRISKLVYDDAGQVIQVRQAVGTADEATERTLTYTNNGLVQTLTDAENNKTTYVYDGTTGCRRRSFQRRRRRAQARAIRTTAVGGSAIAYDGNGNLVTDGVAGKNYLYTSENQLRVATGGGVPGVTLAYDPAMRLYEDKFTTSGAATRFAYDGLGAIAEYDNANALQRRYVFDPTTGQPVVQYEGAGTGSPRYLSSDERGSIISQSDGSGALLGINTYDEYGRPGASNIGRYQYTGQKWIAEIGGYDYKTRVYLPHLGVFAQMDPIG